MADSQSICVKCLTEAKVTDIGSASKRKTFRCGDCGRTWREKSLVAVSLGSLGGRSYAQNHSPEERSKRAEEAANARWRKEKDAERT